MPKTKDNYQIVGNSLDEVKRNLNFMLQRFADRMDKIEGIRGASSIESDLTMNENRIVEIGSGTSSTDAARIGDLTPNSPTFANITATGNITVGGDIKVYDALGALIHSLE